MDTTARTNRLRTRLGLAILALTFLSGPDPASPADAEGTFTVVGTVSEVTRASAERAVALYAAAGIDLPHFSLREGCDPSNPVDIGSAAKAWYSPNAHANSPTVTVCDPAQLRVMLHELAHHWDLTVLGKAHRDRMTRILGVDGWLSHDVPYEDRGGEHWADVIAWGLMPCDMLGRVEAWGGDSTIHGLSRLEAGDVFALSTGIPPVHGYDFDPDGVCG